MLTKATTGMSLHLRTGLDYLTALPVDELNDIARTVAEYFEAVEKRGKK